MKITEQDFDEAISYTLLQGDMVVIGDGSRTRQPGNRINPELIQREKERAARAQLNSSDGNVVEQHDQFYRDHKLLLILFRALAVMPIERSQPGRMTFSWRSASTIYAIVFYIVTTGIVLLVGYERLKMLQVTDKFDDYIYAIIFVIFLVPHFWIPFVGWGVAHQVAVYKTMWSKFQVRYYRITGHSLEFPRLNILILVISIGCLLCAVIFLLSLSYLMEGFTLWHTSAYYHIVTMINMNCALWYINCRAIRTTSSALSQSFRRDVSVECTASLISQYRYLWLNLSELLQQLGNAYTRTYATYCLFM